MSDRHRDSADQCRECGRYDLTSAPANCTRCHLVLARQAGAAVVPAAELRGLLRHDEHWEQVAQDLSRHRLAGGRFYVYAAHDSGERLAPLPQLRASYPTAPAANAAGRGQLTRYPHIWVVTSIGAWQITQDVKLT